MHHGKLFVVLDLSRADAERTLAIDVFHQQHLNVDRSGRGSLPKLIANLERFGTGNKGVVTLTASSLTLQPSDITDRVGQVRLFCIDGAHTEEATYNDLMLADATLLDKGVVALDDYFNQQFPGVSVATVHFLLEHGASAVPFLVSPNKLFLTRPAASDSYRDFIRRQFAGHLDKTVEMLGNIVLVVGTIPRTPLIRLRRSPIGKLLARLRSRMGGVKE